MFLGLGIGELGENKGFCYIFICKFLYFVFVFFLKNLFENILFLKIERYFLFFYKVGCIIWGIGSGKF